VGPRDGNLPWVRQACSAPAELQCAVGTGGAVLCQLGALALQGYEPLLSTRDPSRRFRMSSYIQKARSGDQRRLPPASPRPSVPAVRGGQLGLLATQAPPTRRPRTDPTATGELPIRH
jgi:hypothetical protein